MSPFEKKQYQETKKIYLSRLTIIAIILALLTIAFKFIPTLKIKLYFLISILLIYSLFMVFDLIYIKREYKTKRFVPNLLSLLAFGKMFVIFVYFYFINTLYTPDRIERISFVSHLVIVYFAFKSLQTHFLIKKIRAFKNENKKTENLQ